MTDDGSKLAFTCGAHIYILNTENSEITDLEVGGGGMISPDGSKIVFGGVKIMNSDGSGLTKLEVGETLVSLTTNIMTAIKSSMAAQERLTKKQTKV